MPWNTNLPEAEWYTPDSPELPQLLSMLDDYVPILAIDTETTGLDTYKSMPLFWSLSWGENRVCMPASTLHMAKPLLSNPKKQWVLANAKFDQHILANAGVQLAGDLIDVQVMHSLLYEDQSHRLKDMSHSLFGWVWSDFTDTFRMNKSGKLTVQSTPEEVARGGAFRDVPDAILWTYHNDLPRLIEYAANDAYGTWKCYENLKHQLESTNIHSLYPDMLKTMADYFFKVEMPFTKVLWECERNGVTIDIPYLENVSSSVRVEMSKLEREIVKAVGRPINLNSPKDLQKYFYKELGLKPPKLTKGGKSGVRSPSIDKEALEALSCDHPIAYSLLQWRELATLLQTFTTGLPTHVQSDGRIHTTFHQDVARTGRLSSREPNLQN